ncbi:hypothetical protein NW249_23970 [Streptomyces sp. OUCMDZ-4982]|uniref:hypothetical protein n=1 Tax=Streptomyces sp. OUCMDZ-4982 TaxID=2973090 RepID=UPI00215D0E07|nr:hypothetical protein [Streptomyces sp. OUCMDZ-4982]MCR8945178.1 hypothetical protein [Streptomyces sp. OUCMDZ-4982]
MNRRNRSGLTRWLSWGTGGLAVVAALLTGYAVFSGDDETATSDRPPAVAGASPSPTYDAPSDWTEPDRWAALPRGARTDDQGNEVGFPRTVEGAVAMLVASNSTEFNRERSHVDVQLGVYESYLIPADRTEKNRARIRKGAAENDALLRRTMGLAEGGVLPAGAYSRNQVVAYKVIEASPTEVSAWLLSRATVKTGELEPEQGSYTSTLAAVEWAGGSWWVSAASTENAMRRHGHDERPPIAAPGDAAFNSGGWTAIRAAS